jgi:hypothetical protein
VRGLQGEAFSALVVRCAPILRNVGSNPERSEPEFSNHVRRIYSSLDELFEAGEAVRSLVTHPGWVHISRLIEEKIAEIDFSLDGRLLATRSEYAHQHGQRHGLRAMQQAADAIVAVAERKRREQQAKHEGTAEPEPIGAHA